MPKAATTIKVYDKEIVLSESAAKLLGLDNDSPEVAFMYDADAAMAKRQRLYVAGITGKPWPLKYFSHGKGRRRIITCRELCGKIAESLGGFGTYRICEEDNYTDGQTVWYNIFFRKYD